MVPVIRPEVGMIDRLYGRPDWLKVREAVPLESSALTWKDTTSPSLFCSVPMGPSEIPAATFQANSWLTMAVPSVTVMIGAKAPTLPVPAAMVPVIRPVVGLIARPLGRPDAEYFTVT